jgi:hypothetical protein
MFVTTGCSGGDSGSLSGKGDGAPEDAAIAPSSDAAAAGDAAGSPSDASEAGLQEAGTGGDATGDDAPESGPPTIPDASTDGTAEGATDSAAEGAPDSGCGPCDSPPAPTCAAGIETDYASSGTCVAGASDSSCSYPATTKTCANGCAATGDRCANDPCAGVDCAPETPVDTCSGLTWTHYAPDTCSAGACVQHPSSLDCSGSNLCVAYACSAGSGCSSAPVRDGTACPSVMNGFCLAGTCTARALTVSVSPAVAAVRAPGQVPLTATVTSNDPSDATSVTWSMAPSGAGTFANITGTSAVYTTPASVSFEGTTFVTATSTADATQTATATITVAGPLAVSFPLGDPQVTHLGAPLHVFVHTSNLLPTETGAVTLTADMGSLGPVSCVPRGPGDGGSVDCQAVYTPSTVSPPYAHVTATSTDDLTTKATLVIGVIPDVTVTMTGTVAVSRNNSIQVSATLSNLGGNDTGAGTFSLGAAVPAGYQNGTLSGSTSCSAMTMGSSTCVQTYLAPGPPPLPMSDIPVTVPITFTSGDESTATARGRIDVVP